MAREKRATNFRLPHALQTHFLWINGSMIRMSYQYPGDAPTDAKFMFGAEFFMYDRGGKPGEIRVTSDGLDESVSFEDILCDSCNAQIRMQDPCASTPDRLYCWTCAGQWVLPHLLPSQTIEVLFGTPRA